MVVVVPVRADYLLLYHRARLPERLQLPNYWGRHGPGVDYGIGSDLRHYLRRDRPLDRLCDGHGVSCRGPGHGPHSRPGERPDHCPTACAVFHCHAGYVRYCPWCGLYSLWWTTCQHTDEWHRSDRQCVPALPPARWTCELLPPALKLTGSTSQSDCSTASLSLDSPGRGGPYLCLAALADALWKTYVRRWWERRGFAARGYSCGSSYHSDLCAFGVHGIPGRCALYFALQQWSRRRG